MNRIKEIRMDAGLTQEQLGERVNMSKANISKLEKSRRGLNLDTMRLIARALNVSVADLLVEEDAGLRPSAREAQILLSFRQLNEPGKDRTERIFFASIDEDSKRLIEA